MKILYVCSEPALMLGTATGHTAHVASMIKAFQEVGCVVVPVITGERASEVRAKSAYRNLIDRILPSVVAKSLRDVYRIWRDYRLVDYYERLFRHENPDLVYERYTHLSQSCSVSAQRALVPLAVEVNAPVEEMRISRASPFYLVAGRYQERVLARADAVIAVSKALARHLSQKGTDESKICVVPNGVDPHLFKPQPERREQVRQKLGLEDKVVVGYIGSFGGWHSVGILLDAAEMILEQAQAVHFLFVGDENKDPEVVTKGASMRGSVTFVGAVPHSEVPAYVDAMDICAVTAPNWYASPIKAFEYGAMGKAVISPRVGPVEEIIQDGVTGLLFQPEGVESLASSLLHIVQDVALRETLGSNLREHVIRNHTWQINAARTLQLFPSILGAERPAGHQATGGVEGNG